ncbi:baeRF3 domain-containing protein [Aporhodopirellula aestuarii]|uniref:Uncharacterized protein n=1 Tax=Aporhodopirellula aestuarii TaxID=2950107 RepID=A0ABT0TZI5_9BACT|nr:hypothetical protein [Aporhodopirellula aestuarii]MCM2369940.1 hypothetical protein [Aporhodopirellula aestuarii]
MSTAIKAASVNRLKSSDLQKLAQITATPCVSIVMPTHRSGRETQQGTIRLKNLITKATQQLEANDQDASFLDPLKPLLNDSNFWQHQSDGLAIFATPDDCHLFHLNRDVPEHVSVGNDLFLTPLVPNHNARGAFFVLSLSWDEAKLFRCEDGELTSVETKTLPGKYHDFVVPRDPEVSLQNTSHRSVGNTPGTSTAMFHGHGEGEDKIEADRDQYLSLVGEQVAGEIYNTDMPLIVVATTETCGHFESTTDMEIAAKVEGSPSQWSDHQFQERVMQTANEELPADTGDFLQRFGTAVAQSQGSSDYPEILEAAHSGRVETVVAFIDSANAEDVNKVVLETLRHGGKVTRCESGFLPDGTDIAAIFRF